MSANELFLGLNALFLAPAALLVTAAGVMLLKLMAVLVRGR